MIRTCAICGKKKFGRRIVAYDSIFATVMQWHVCFNCMKGLRKRWEGSEVKEPETSKQTVYGTWEKADEIPYYPNIFERIWNLIKNMFTRRK